MLNYGLFIFNQPKLLKKGNNGQEISKADKLRFKGNLSALKDIVKNTGSGYDGEWTENPSSDPVAKFKGRNGEILNWF